MVFTRWMRENIEDIKLQYYVNHNNFLVSAFYGEHYDKRISVDGYIWSKSKFLGLSIGVHMIGQGRCLFLLFFLAHLVMSLCNHALSVVCRCRRRLCRRRPCHWRRHLCTALPVTALIIETSYLANICSYTPSICTWNIRSMWHIFFKWQPF